MGSVNSAKKLSSRLSNCLRACDVMPANLAQSGLKCQSLLNPVLLDARFAKHRFGVRLSFVMRAVMLQVGLAGWMFSGALWAGRINQEGRILAPLPVVTNAILFDTSNADAVVSAMQIFPVTNPWNECISNRTLLANSDAMMVNI